VARAVATASPPSASPHAYRRHRPETTALYELVRDNLETLFGAIDDGAIAVRVPKHARKELLAYLECGLLCRGFARLRCEECGERRLVAFSCKGRGFCPSCLGRRMNATAANLMERMLPETGLRQWVLTFPFPWRRRLAQDGVLLGKLSRIFVETMQRFYCDRAAWEGAPGGKTGSVTAVQRTSSDLRLHQQSWYLAFHFTWSSREGGVLASQRTPPRTSFPFRRRCATMLRTGSASRSARRISQGA
jgi:hypothetical protein